MTDSQRAVSWLTARAGTHVQVGISWLGTTVATFEGICDLEPGADNQEGVRYRIGDHGGLVVPEHGGARYRINDDLLMELSNGVELRVRSTM
jgi:hypothetical protein